MDNLKDKITDLNDRISKIERKISDLTQVKINLMMLKRDFQMEDVKDVLTHSLKETIREIDLD